MRYLLNNAHLQLLLEFVLQFKKSGPLSHFTRRSCIPYPFLLPYSCPGILQFPVRSLFAISSNFHIL